MPTLLQANRTQLARAADIAGHKIPGKSRQTAGVAGDRLAQALFLAETTISLIMLV